MSIAHAGFLRLPACVPPCASRRSHRFRALAPRSAETSRPYPFRRLRSIWFGFGMLPKILIVANFTFFPVMLNCELSAPPTPETSV